MAVPATLTPKSPGVATSGMLREVLRKLRADMMEAEAHVPWSAVRHYSRKTRTMSQSHCAAQSAKAHVSGIRMQLALSDLMMSMQESSLPHLLYCCFVAGA